MLHYLFKKLGIFIIILFCASLVNARSLYTKTADGVEINIPNTANANGAVRVVKLQVVSDKIIHVTASPTNSFSSDKSLMVVKIPSADIKYEVKETPTSVEISTLEITAKVVISTGQVSFTDKKGNALLAESNGGGKTFTENTVDGKPLYALRQAFQSTPNEAFYGLGQHQNGVMDYKNSQVEMQNYNTDVAIPFLVSNKNYGILWENYSITQVMDSRSFEPLSTMRLFAADGTEGWLTATYFSKTNPAKIFATRAETAIDYNYIPNLKNLPDSVKLEGTNVKWEGSVSTDFTGTHTFFFRSAGYAKIWIDGKLLADRWRHSWNPGTALLKVAMEKGKKYSFRIEWDPDGGQSYIGCKWLKPLEAAAENEFSFRSEGGHQIDYYFVYGPNMDEVISGYRQLTGKAAIVPKWAMGFWQSRERYKTQDEILSTVAEFRKRKIPLDNIVEDWSYWKQDQWGSHEFDGTRFPDAAAMIKELHEKFHAQFMISVWPKFYEGTANYDYMNKNGWLYKRNIANRQRDWIAKGFVNTFYNAYNPEAGKAFWGLMNKQLYTKGVDAWWMDASEPDIESNLSPELRKTLSGPTALGSSTQYFNAFALQNSKAVYEGQRSVDPNKRVFILTRSAYGGMQRYAAATWSGDIAARWEDFKNQIPAGINFGMSGMPYWTTDIGGFAVEKRYEKPSAQDLDEWQEQATRWYQFGAFCPLFRVHGQFPFREIYNTSSENEAPYKSMLYYDKLRYRLMPYIYSLAQKTYHEDYTMMRGLPMDFANDEKVKNIADQYMFGPAFLISPITDYKARSRQLYLPAGTGWYDFNTGKFEEGGKEITADAPLEKMPLYVKEGAIVPVGPDLQYVAEKPADPITLFVYTGKDVAFKLYEDDGLNYDYEKGQFSVIPITYNEAAKTLTIGERIGTFQNMLQQHHFKIVWVTKNKPMPIDADTKAAATVTYNGKKIQVKM